MGATATLAPEAAPAPAFAPSQRLRAIGVSEILRITDHANALRRAGLLTPSSSVGYDLGIRHAF